MKLLVCLLVCLCACVFAEDQVEHHEEKRQCGPLEKIKVQRQWDKAFGEGSHRLEFSQHFWGHFFKDNPTARELFKDVRGDNIYSAQFQAAGLRMLNTLSIIIDTADDPEAQKEIIAQTKVRHTEAGFKPEFYDPFRDSLLETLPEYLGTHLDWDAWTLCFDRLIDKLTH